MSFRLSGSVAATGGAVRALRLRRLVSSIGGTKRAYPSAPPRALPKPEISRQFRLPATNGYGFAAKLFKLGRLTGHSSL